MFVCLLLFVGFRGLGWCVWFILCMILSFVYYYFDLHLVGLGLLFCCLLGVRFVDAASDLRVCVVV